MPLSYFTRDADTLDGYDSTDFLKTGSNVLTGSQYISGSLYVLYSVHANDFTGSLTMIDNGVPYILAGPNITVTTNSIGQIEISGSATSGGGGGGSNGAGQDIYSGYTTNSLNWSATTWTDFHTVATDFTSSIAPGNITLSGSTFTVTNAGVYYWISNFNCFGNNGWYVGWRISGSNGTLLQQTNYSVIDQGPGVVAGLINLSAGESFKFQYAGKYGGGNPATWGPTNPLDGENMRTGNITIYKIA